MAARRKESAGLIFVKAARGLVPASPLDAEDFDRIPVGAEFDLVKRTKRSSDQLRLWWAVLGFVVEATGRWPTRDHLCEALKRELGYVEVRTNLIGQPYLATESIALDGMAQDEFQKFFDQGMALLAGAVGFDPVAEYIASKKQHSPARMAQEAA